MFLSIVFLIPVNEIYARYTRSIRVRIVKPTASKQVIVIPTRTLTPSPTLKLTRIPIPTKVPVTPTLIPVLSGQLKSGQAPIQPFSTTSDLKKDFIMQKINDYRKSQGLSEVKSDLNTCNFAKTRAEEISSNFNHDGFRSRIDSKTLPYSGYGGVTENIAMNSDYTKIVDMWINSSGHADNMRKDTPYVCVESKDNYYAYEGWRP